MIVCCMRDESSELEHIMYLKRNFLFLLCVLFRCFSASEYYRDSFPGKFVCVWGENRQRICVF